MPTKTLTAEFDVRTDGPLAQDAVDAAHRALTGPATEQTLERYGIVLDHVHIIPTMWTGVGETPPTRVAATLIVHDTYAFAEMIGDAMRAIAEPLTAENVTYREVR